MSEPKRRLLDPTERFSEILFGLIMVLTFTGTLSVAEAGRADVREMLVAALGCNFAWGIVDAVMYLVTVLVTRSRSLRAIRSVREGADAAMLADVLPEEAVKAMTPRDLESLRGRLAFAALWVPQLKVLGGNLGLSVGSAEKFAWAHGEVRGLINLKRPSKDGALVTRRPARSSDGRLAIGQTLFI